MRGLITLRNDMLMRCVAMAAVGFVALGVGSDAFAGPPWRIHDMTRPEATVIDPGGPGKAPSDAVVLFDGTDLSQWNYTEGGTKVENGYIEIVRGRVTTKQSFGDCQLHVEWASPINVKGNSQGRGNSGVFLMNIFEVQVLDSYGNHTYADGHAASIYGQHPPLVNASRGPGEWQTYDIIFRGPRFNEDNSLARPAHMTVLHNGVLVQDNAELTGPTAWLTRAPYPEGVVEGPIGLQDHGNPLRYRNIWLRELNEPNPKDSPFVEPELPKVVSVPPHVLDSYVGTYGNTRVTREGNRLFVQSGGQGRMEVFAQSPTEFECALLDGRYEFLAGDSGNIEKLKFTIADSVRTFNRKD